MKVEQFKDIHKGQRCFVIGTGPSLNKVNFSLIKNEILFGVNRLYKGYDKFDINCKYYGVSGNTDWILLHKDLLKLNTVLFSPHVGDGQKTVRCPVRSPHVFDGHFSKDPTKSLRGGGSVIISICLQVAYYMGFSKVYLLGCDCDYTNQFYFDGTAPTDKEYAYARKVDSKNNLLTGDWSRIFNSYKTCKKVYEEAGREIVNCTVGGKLEIFRRQTLEDLFGI